MAKTEDQGKRVRLQGKGRRLAFHAAAAALVVSPLVAVELVLRLCVPAPAIRPEDPYVSFTALPPLFVLDPNGTRYETTAERLVAFRRQTFRANKAPGTFRIFCLGGSTVQGRPYSVETSFTAWLQLALRAAQPETNWEVINCGGISYATYRLMPIMRELSGYQPDLLILYTGHNEFLESRTYANFREVPRVLVHLHRVMLNLRSYALADRWLAHHGHRHTPPTVMSADVQTRLDQAEGLESYHRDPTWRRNIIAHFRYNLDIMVGLARQERIPVILVNPVVNLKDCPPFKSEFRTDLTERDGQRGRDLWNRARGLGWTQTDIYRKIDLLEQAAAFDDRHARLLFLLGTCCDRIGQWAEAKQWFVRAKDEDICPLRILEPMREVIRNVALKHRLHLVDVQAMIEARSDNGIPGDQWLLDHVHPTIAGHQLIAEALFRAMVEMGLTQVSDSWESAHQQLWQNHLASLNDAYYAQGRARLKRLRDWSRGRILQE